MATRGATQQSSAPYNRRIVLDVIRRAGPISRKAIVDAVSLSPQTVANITQELESIGLIVSQRARPGSRGQPPIAFELNPRGGGSVGISLEPGRIVGAYVNLVGEITRRSDLAVDTRDSKLALQGMVSLVEDLLPRRGGSERLWGIGIALPGPLAPTDISFVGPTALEGWTDLSVFDELRVATQIQVFYSLDSVAGALGECLFGVARALDDFFYIHFAVGLGGTLVTGRSAYRGAGGNASEFGHIPIVPGGKSCYCGNSGCLEQYLSLHSLAQSLGVDVSQLTDELIRSCRDAQDPRFDAWCREAALRLRDAVRVLENLLDPAAIIVGGSAPAPLVDRLLELAQPLAPSLRSGAIATASRILRAERRADSLILGAAVLPIYEILAPRLQDLQQARRDRPNVTAVLGQRDWTKSARL